MDFEDISQVENLRRANVMQLDLVSRWCQANEYAEDEKDERMFEWIAKYSKPFRVIIDKNPGLSLEEIEGMLYESVDIKEAA